MVIKKSKTTNSSIARTTKSPIVSFSTKPGILAILAGVLILVGGLWVLLSRAGVNDQYTYAGQATAGLDNTGKTIPSHNYPLPTSGKVIYMSPRGTDKNSNSVDGNDANDGLTINTPVETLTAAYNKVKSSGSGTIVLRGGTYRSWHADSAGQYPYFITGDITFQAYLKEEPWFVGTDPVKDGWTLAGTNVWKRSWSTPNFCRSHFDSGAVGYRQKVKRLDGVYVSPVTSGARQSETPYGAQSGLAPDAQQVCTWPDNLWTRKDRLVDVDGDPQMAFIGNTELTQRKTLSLLSTNPDSFYYDWDNEVIYINKDPVTNTVELAKRHGLLSFAGAYNFQWKGIGIKRFASSVLDAVMYAGLGGDNNARGSLVLENSVFSENAGGTLSLNDAKKDTAIRRSVFARNYATGMGFNGFSRKADPVNWRNDITIDSSIYASNNRGLMDSACSASCYLAGVKLNNAVGYTVKNSIFENNYGTAHGLWCDIDCSDGKAVNNIFRNNGGHGVFYEISSKGIIANNLIYNNSWTGLVALSASTKIYNNTLVNKTGSSVQAVWIMDDDRPAPDKGETWPYTIEAMKTAHSSLGVSYAVRVGPNTNATEFANNLIVSQPSPGARLMNFGNNGLPYSPNTTSSDYFNELNNNIYYRVSGQPLYGWGSNGGIMSSVDLRSVSGQNWEQNSIDVVGSGDPFIDRSAEDFRLKTDSQAYINKGKALPTDVAAAIGVPAGIIPVRGVIFPTTTTTTVTPTTTSTVTPTTTTTVSPTPTSTTTVSPTTTTTVSPTTTTTITPPPPTTDTTAPSTPTNVKASVVFDALRFSYYNSLRWSASYDNVGVSRYLIKRNGTQIGTSTTTKFQDYSIVANTYYTYSIYAQDAAGNTSTASTAKLVGKCFLIWCWAE